MKNNGLLICFSGIDGSGKSTYIKCVSEYLINEKKKNVIVCDAMKPCDYTERLKEVSQKLSGNMFDIFGSEFVNTTYAIDLIKNLENIIIPSLEKGNIVITHRYDLCCKAYSMLSNCNMGVINRVLDICPKPDLHLYLDVNAEIAVSRINERCITTGIKKADKENYKTLTKARTNYMNLLENNYANVKIIDTSCNIEEENRKKVLNAVKQLFEFNDLEERD